MFIIQKSINNKRYNTESAVKVGCWDNGKAPESPEHYNETLYRKKTGEFFLHGQGGSESIYSKKAVGKASVPGEDIVLLTYEQARNFTKEKLSPAEYDSFFTVSADDEGRETVTLSLPKSTVQALRLLSSQTGLGIGEVVTDFVRFYKSDIYGGQSKMDLNKEGVTQEYILGVVYSIMEEIVETVGGEFQPIDFSNASSTPSKTFPLLIIKTEKALSKGFNFGGSKAEKLRKLEREYVEAISEVGNEFPERLTIPQKGSFQIGYYHRRHEAAQS